MIGDIAAITVLDNTLRHLVRHNGLAVRYPEGRLVRYGPDKPSLTIHIKNARGIRPMLTKSTRGMGESYMDDYIDFDGDIAVAADVAYANRGNLPHLEHLTSFMSRHNEHNDRSRQAAQVRSHYGQDRNDLYGLFLDSTLTYSCGIFPPDRVTALEEAQDIKRRKVLIKAEAGIDKHLLDIGCGWGQLLITAAQEYGCTGIGISPVPEQCFEANRRAKELGLDDRIQFVETLYQDLPQSLDDSFDAVVSVGMFEHVGAGNELEYFQAVKRLLKPGGLSVLHTISHPVESDRVTLDPFIATYIFPGGHIPGETMIRRRMYEAGLYFEHCENFGGMYAKTLQCWQDNFETNIPKIMALVDADNNQKYDERFIRMWRFYLAICRGGFNNGMGLTQWVMRNGERGERRLHDYAVAY